MYAYTTLLNRRWGVLCACALLVCLGACRRPSTPSEHAALTGRVALVRADTLELTIQPANMFHGRPPRSIMCLLTRDSELYINDRLADLRELQLGDELELVGYYENKDAPEERFVVAAGHVVRSEPPPPSLAVDLPAPASQPATPENQSKAPS